MTTATLDPNALAHFTGSGDFFAHGLRRNFVHTEGMEYLAESAGAYWLIDIAASYQGRRLDAVCQGFQVWRLRKLPEGCKNKAEVTCWTDNPKTGRRVIRQLIPYTDFPFEALGSDEFTFWVEGAGEYRWTAMLPSEH